MARDLSGQYDNLPDLGEALGLDLPDFFRAAGACICPGCQQEYRKHPYSQEYRDWLGTPYLNVLCDGSLVKL